MIPKIQLPIIIIGFGSISDRKLLAVSDGWNAVFPIFTDPEIASHYLKWYNDELSSMVLSVAASGECNGDYCNPNKLNTFVIDTIQQARDVIELMTIVSSVTLIALNPPANQSDTCLCLEIDEFLEALDAV